MFITSINCGKNGNGASARSFYVVHWLVRNFNTAFYTARYKAELWFDEKYHTTNQFIKKFRIEEEYWENKGT